MYSEDISLHQSFHIFILAVRSRSASPTTVLGITRIDTPTRRSRRISERSNTPTEEITPKKSILEIDTQSRRSRRLAVQSNTPSKETILEESILESEKEKRTPSLRKSSTPKQSPLSKRLLRSNESSPEGTPKQSRKSDGYGRLTIMEPLIEEDAELHEVKRTESERYIFIHMWKEPSLPQYLTVLVLPHLYTLILHFRFLGHRGTNERTSGRLCNRPQVNRSILSM